MKKLVSLLIIVLLLSYCEEEEPANIDRFFYQNSELSPPEDNVGMYVNWESGDKTVFRYIFNHPDEENIADDELSEVFWIEIPSEVSEFRFELGEDSPYEFYYTRVCFCYFASFEFEELTVSGKKINATTWEIDFNMKATSSDLEDVFELKDSGKYELTQQ